MSCFQSEITNETLTNTWNMLSLFLLAGSGLQVKAACTVTSGPVCEHLEGLDCVSSVGHSCERAQRHSSCEPRQDISKHVSFLFLNEADHIYCLLHSNSNTHMKKQQHLTASCRNVRCDHSGSSSPPLPAAWCFWSTVKVQSVSCRNTNVHEHNYKQDYLTPVYYSLELDWWLWWLTASVRADVMADGPGGPPGLCALSSSG